MNTSSDNPNNAKAFTDAIKRMAAAECKKIDDETAEIEKTRLELLESDAKSRYDSFLDYELARVNADTNHRISELNEQAKVTLTGKRNELTDKVFACVEARLREYRISDSYKQSLICAAKEIEKDFPDGELEFHVSPDDIKFATDIQNGLTKKASVSADASIVFGGIKAIDKKTNCLADNTLDAKLQKQKQLFLSTSGLKI